MRLLFASDLHGSRLHYDGLLALARSLRPDAILLGGDLLSNAAPLLQAAAAQRSAVRGMLAKWCAAAGAPVYWIAGNHEWRAVVEPPPPAGICVHGRCVPLGDWDLIGFSLVSPTPYWILDHERAEETPNRHESRGRCYASSPAGPPVPVDKPDEWLAARPTLAAELRALPAPRDWRRTILMAHDPPYDSGLDTRFGNFPVGSSDVRTFILEKKPAISLHGHIHEAPILTGKVMHRVGETWGFNAGRAERAIRAVLLDPEKPETAELCGTPDGGTTT